MLVEQPPDLAPPRWRLPPSLILTHRFPLSPFWSHQHAPAVAADHHRQYPPGPGRPVGGRDWSATIRRADAFIFVIPEQFLDENRQLRPNEIMTEAAAAMLDELARVEAALRPLREPEAPEPAEPETEDVDPAAEMVR